VRVIYVIIYNKLPSLSFVLWNYKENLFIIYSQFAEDNKCDFYVNPCNIYDNKNHPEYEVVDLQDYL